MLIVIYSFFYMSPYRKVNYFLWLLFLFVVSMLIVVSFRSLFFLMLGWDGLGLVSFLLIMFYQNSSSIYSSLVTLIMNRIGDCFFLLAIVLFFFSRVSLDCVAASFFSESQLTLYILILRFITKRAIFPFSPWLPLAIAAPTPISALVHSSTLVTSGLYLMIRFSYFIYRNSQLCELLVALSVFTSFYAGLNSVFETDLKKLVALSTLSHLGFISSSLFLGILEIRFFHLISHALFKSLLFMALGDVLITLGHSQDIRYLSAGFVYTPFSFYALYVSIMSLLGLTGTVGYFSKDVILEFYYFSETSALRLSLLVLRVCFTFFYSLKIFYYSFSLNKLRPYQLVSGPRRFHAFRLLARSLATVSFGFFFCSMCCPFLLYVITPLTIKFYPLFLAFCGVLILLMVRVPSTVKGQAVSLYGGGMCFLSLICVQFTSAWYQTLLAFSVKSAESGAFAALVAVMPVCLLKTGSELFFKQLINPSFISFYCAFFFLLGLVLTS